MISSFHSVNQPSFYADIILQVILKWYLSLYVYIEFFFLLLNLLPEAQAILKE